MFHLYPKLALVVDWYVCCCLFYVWIWRGWKIRESSIPFVDMDIVSCISIIFAFSYCPIFIIYTLLIQIHTPSIVIVAAAGVSTVGRQQLISGCVWQFNFVTHPLRTPRLFLLFNLRLGSETVGWGLIHPHFLQWRQSFLGCSPSPLFFARHFE